MRRSGKSRIRRYNMPMARMLGRATLVVVGQETQKWLGTRLSDIEGHIRVDVYQREPFRLVLRGNVGRVGRV